MTIFLLSYSKLTELHFERLNVTNRPCTFDISFASLGDGQHRPMPAFLRCKYLGGMNEWPKVVVGSTLGHHIPERLQSYPTAFQSAHLPKWHNCTVHLSDDHNPRNCEYQFVCMHLRHIIRRSVSWTQLHIGHTTPALHPKKGPYLKSDSMWTACRFSKDWIQMWLYWSWNCLIALIGCSA